MTLVTQSGMKIYLFSRMRLPATWGRNVPSLFPLPGWAHSIGSESVGTSWVLCAPWCLTPPKSSLPSWKVLLYIPVYS